MLRTVKKILPPTSLKMVYYTIFHCHLIYAIQVWSCCTQKLINDLFKLQKSAIRIICNVNYNSHTEPLFKREDILPLPDLISFFKVQFMHRFSQNFLLPPLTKFGFEIMFIQMAKTKFNCEIKTNSSSPLLELL